MKRKILVKFCGLRTIDDVRHAWGLGVDFIGFVCHTQSPRYIDAAEVKRIIQEAKHKGPFGQVSKAMEFPKTVGLFVDKSKEQVYKEIEEGGFDIVQMYDERFLSELPCPYWKVRHIQKMSDVQDIATIKEEIADGLGASALILDSKASDKILGGSGRSFDWDFLSSSVMSLQSEHGEHMLADNVFIAGGISLDTIKTLLKYHPYGVDISSGIESQRGVKDHNLMRQMMDKIRRDYEV